MWIGVITIFPELFGPFLSTSLVGRAVAEELVEVEVRDLRDWTDDRHRVVDDEPYGGGGGMVMKAPPIVRAVREVGAGTGARRILLSPQGRRLDDAGVRELAAESAVVLVCGRYEGVDERVRDMVIDDEVSLGDFVLSGGEVAAMAVIEAVSRYVPGVVGRPESVEKESFHTGLLDHPHYTRPAEYEGLTVPDVLLSGHHAEIARWRRLAALRNTLAKRPDLLATADLSPAEARELERVRHGATAEAGDTGLQREEN